MSGNVIFLQFTSPHVDDDQCAWLACRNCQNKTFTLTRDRPEDFPLMKCAACQQHVGRMGWSHDDDEPEPPRDSDSDAKRENAERSGAVEAEGSQSGDCEAGASPETKSVSATYRDGVEDAAAKADRLVRDTNPNSPARIESDTAARIAAAIRSLAVQPDGSD